MVKKITKKNQVESEGLALLEVYVNEEQISESPLFVRVEKPVCLDADGGEDPTRVANDKVTPKPP